MKTGLRIVLTVAALAAATLPAAAAAAPAPQCWGQASAVFAQTGELGEHSASFATPRLGIRNLARQLAAAGVIADDTMASLGAWTSDQLGLSVAACMT